MIKAVLVAVCAAAVSGCAPSISPKTYSPGAVGQVNRTVAATVISVRDVDISGTSGVGGTAGALAGGVAGSAIGGGVRSNVIGAIGGAVIGGVAGAIAEQGMTAQRGLEYVVETANGNLMTVVQGGDPTFAQGQKVLVLYGAPSRLIADPRP